VDRRDGKMMFKIAELIDSGDKEAVRAIFDQHPEQINEFTPFAGGTWLHYAARDSTLGMTKLLLEIGFPINRERKNDYGGNALESAGLGDHVDIAEYLLDQGAIIDVSTSWRNPLFAAIVGGSQSVTKLLLERGIDATVRYNSDTMDDMDAVAFALYQREPEIAHMIALWNAKGDKAEAEAALTFAAEVAERNLKPTKRKKK
jgi:uncharacterized protein